MAQARVDDEKRRLASVRVREVSELAVAAGVISGQAVSAASTLEELLRRPHVHYRRGPHPTLPAHIRACAVRRACSCAGGVGCGSFGGAATPAHTCTSAPVL